ncbi:MAG: hypothetical protein JAY74_09055 [Candidatus Thiodiazotropha taylori]|nr:hypothetical protein [Candidatus Thiodiazotropha taylori]
MAINLPPFPPFQVHAEEQSAGTRWRKYLAKFENLLTALNIVNDDRKKAMLLHYIGEEAYDIYDSFSDEKKGKGATVTVGDVTRPNEYPVLKQSLTDYFTPKANTSYEVFKFRQAKQNAGEAIDSYYTRLRTLASTCEFHNADNEILGQIIQGCTSTRIRRRALRDNYNLDKLLDEARAIELAESRATAMEGVDHQPQVNQVNSGQQRGRSRSRGHGARGHGHGARGHGARGRGAHGQSRGETRNSDSCTNCGGSNSHKTCPAYGKECRYCKKKNHFAAVCRKKLNKQSVSFAHAEKADTSSDESVFHINDTNRNHKVPSVTAQLGNNDVKFLVDTGASVNILNNEVYKQMPKQPTLSKPCPLIYAYGSSTPLNVLGYFRTQVTFKSKTVGADFYVVQSKGRQNSHCLLGATTAQALDMIHFAFTSLSPSIPDQFQSLFDGKMGKIDGVQVKLHIDQSVQPVSQRHRRIPFHVRKDVEAELQRLEDQGVIEPVSGPTPWVSPVVVVPKKSSGVRVCIDMRMANKAISREKHPMPTADELMADLNSSTVFSKLDLSNAYHQLELAEESRYITTFSTHVGLRRYKRLLFGVNAASEIFQKVISDLLADIQGAKNLSDDIIIHGTDQSDHDRALKLTLERLSSVGAKLNKDKCIFSVDKITFYGHVFSSLGVSADPEKVKAIVGRAPPKNPAEVRSFLGMTQYVSRYVHQYATLTEPLRRLTRQDVPWSWSRDEQTAFESLKTALSSAQVMVYFDQNKPTEVIVDASPVGVAAILAQDGKVVCYASRALTDVEQRYSQTDREMLAVVYGVEHFHLYLFASDFRVVTDHKPLLGIVHSQKPASARMERWRLRLMPYQFTLEYRPGKDDLNPADFMSRHPYEQPTRDNAAEAYVAFISQNAVPKAMRFDEVQRATLADLSLQKVMTAVQTGRWWDDPDLSLYCRFKDEFSVYDGVVLRDHRLVIPSSLQDQVIDIAHNTHQGIVKTKQLIREKVWFPGIDKMVEETVRACIPCQASYPGPSKREPICPTPLPPEPWSEIALDFAGPFPSGQYVLVALDEHSRFPEVEIVPSTSAKTVIPRLSSIFARQGFLRS